MATGVLIHYPDIYSPTILLPVMKRIITPSFLLALLLIAGCVDDDDGDRMDADAAGVENEIEAVNARFESFIAGQQWDSLASIYTEDAVLMPQGAPMERDPAGIREGFMQMGDMGVTAIDLETQEVEVEGDMAYEIGHYTLRGGGAELDRGKYLVVWKNVDGDWKIHRDIFNSDSPTPGGTLPDTTGLLPGDTAGEGAVPDADTPPDDTTSAY